MKDNLVDSIPDLARMRDAVFYLGHMFIDDTIVDLGSGQGDSIAPFVKALPDYANFHLIDKDADAVRDSVQRFKDDKRIEYAAIDLTQDYPAVSTDLTLAICTLQYIPVRDRLNVLRSAWTTTRNEGALILVEQLDSPLPYLRDLYEGNDRTKIRNYKAYEPAGGAHLLTAQRNEQLLRSAGFKYVDCFYRSNNVAGWIAVKNWSDDDNR